MPDQIGALVQDKQTGWMRAYPTGSKDAASVKRALLDFIGPHRCRLVLSDEADEISLGSSQLGIPHWSFTPRRPQQNGIIHFRVVLMNQDLVDVSNVESCRID